MTCSELSPCVLLLAVGPAWVSIRQGKFCSARGDRWLLSESPYLHRPGSAGVCYLTVLCCFECSLSARQRSTSTSCVKGVFPIGTLKFCKASLWSKLRVLWCDRATLERLLATFHGFVSQYFSSRKSLIFFSLLEILYLHTLFLVSSWVSFPIFVKNQGLVTGPGDNFNRKIYLWGNVMTGIWVHPLVF